MRIPAVLLFAVCLCLLCFGAAPPTQLPTPEQDKLFIFSDDGASITPTNVIWRKNVQVFASDMYLECELLTLLQQTTNQPSSSGTVGFTNLTAQLDTIIAETNLMMMANGTTVLGDRGVYTSSNGVLIVTGDLVIIERSNILSVSTNFVFNQFENSGYAIGWTETVVELSGGLGGTNAPRPGLGPLQRRRNPAQPKSDGTR